MPQHAEVCGFEGFYLPEHIALYPGAVVGSFELPTTLPYLDPLDCLSFVAAATSRILLGTGVLLLPYGAGRAARRGRCHQGGGRELGHRPAGAAR